MRQQIQNLVDQLTAAAAEFSSASAKPSSIVTINNTEEIITKLHTLLSLYETLPMKLTLDERQALSSNEFIQAPALLQTLLERAKGYLAHDNTLVSVFEFNTQFNARVAEAHVMQDEDEAAAVITIEDKAVQALATVNQAYSRAMLFADTTPASAIPDATASVSKASPSWCLPPLPQAEKRNNPTSANSAVK